MSELTLNPQNSAVNLKARINALKDDVQSQTKKWNKETNPAIKDVIIIEIDKLNSEIQLLSDELEEIENKVKGAAKDSLADLINQRNIAYIASDGKYTIITDYSKDPRKVNLKEEVVTYQHLRGILNNFAKSPG